MSRDWLGHWAVFVNAVIFWALVVNPILMASASEGLSASFFKGSKATASSTSLRDKVIRTVS